MSEPLSASDDNALNALGVELGSGDDGPYGVTRTVVHAGPHIGSIELAAERAAARANRSSAPLRETFETLLRTTGPGDTVDVLVALRRSSEILPVGEEVSSLRQTFGLTDEQTNELRHQVVESRLEQMQRDLERSAADLTSRTGIRPEALFAVGNAVRARVDPEQLARLAGDPDVVAVQENLPLVQLGIDAWEAARSAQIDQYIDSGYTGSATGGRIRLGVVDFSFEDDFESIGDSRVAQRWVCANDQPCVSATDLHAALEPGFWFLVWFPDTRHGTACAQIAGGWPSVGTSTYRRARAGSSRAADLYLYQAGTYTGPSTGTELATDADLLRVITRMGADDLDIVSSSVASGSFAYANNCAGTTVTAIAVNDLSRVVGTLWVQAAGNQYHTDPIACTLRDPAGATYSFSVGGLLDTAQAAAPAANYLTVQSGSISDFSSRGNAPYLAGTRSVIATSSVASQIYLPDAMPNVYASIGAGTSYAAPLVAGAAVDLLHLWRNNPGSIPADLRADPGFLYAQMLLMGDRQIEGAGATTVGYDDLYGNGRFRARLWNSAYMDDPWAFGAVRFDLSAGVGEPGVYTVSINSGLALPAGVDRLVAILWWPEPVQGGAGADITVRLRSTCGSPTIYLSDESYDNKKRVVLTGANLGGRCFVLDVYGWSTPPNPWLANASARRVYVAWYYEDEARDDLSSSIQ